MGTKIYLILFRRTNNCLDFKLAITLFLWIDKNLIDNNKPFKCINFVASSLGSLVYCNAPGQLECVQSYYYFFSTLQPTCTCVKLGTIALSSTKLSNAQQCSAMFGNAQQYSAMLSNAQQCSAMLSNAQQYSAMLSNEFQRDSKRIVMLIRLNVFFKKLMSSPPSPPPLFLPQIKELEAPRVPWAGRLKIALIAIFQKSCLY